MSRIRSTVTSCLALAVLACTPACQRQLETRRAAAEAILLVGLSKEPQTLDPHLATTPEEQAIVSALFEGLAACPLPDDPEPRPGAAESWQSNTDGSEWTFFLRRNAEWSDGAPVSAHDFVFAYQRALHPDLGAGCGPELHLLVGTERELPAPSGDMPWQQAIPGVTAVDDFTLRLRLRKPVPDLPARLHHCAWFPVPRHVVLQFGKMADRSNSWSRVPNLVSNGPFRLESWRCHDRIELARNPSFRNPAAVGLNGIRFTTFENPCLETRAFLAGQLHTTSRVPADLLPAIVARSPQALQQHGDRHILLDPAVAGWDPTPGGEPPWPALRFRP